MRTRHLLFILLAASAPAAAADNRTVKPAAELPEIKDLPNPFVFADGSPVRSTDDWGRRRAELKGLFQDYMYGHLPPKPAKSSVTRNKPVDDAENKVRIEDLDIKFEQGDKSFTLRMRLALPLAAKQPVPVIMQSTFGKGGGMQPGKRLSIFTNRGYAVAEFSFNELALDNKDRGRTGGVYTLFGETIDCGALMAWAWGMHRVIDALESVEAVDAKKVVVTGHSRYGKAALIAGAFDERIAVTVPSHSGCAGVAPYRFIFGKSEQLHNVATAFPHWFRPDFKQFVNNVTRLPVDQHLLLALVAPRPLMNTEGTMDTWINPEGAEVSYLAAQKVYEFLKAGDKISTRYRPVAHVPSNEDLLDFADHIFLQKPLPEEFGKLPYTVDKSAIPWDAPK